MPSRVLTEKEKREREREVGGGSPLNVNDQDQAPEVMRGPGCLSVDMRRGV
jgi:hypothetical protein